MKIRERAYRNDWMAVLAEGDVRHADGKFDSWDEMVDAISGADNVPIVKKHGYQGHVSKISDFQLDHVNKLVKARFNAPVHPDDAISVGWVEDDDGEKIVGIDHVAIGQFEPMCPKTTCKLTRNRGEEIEYDPEKFRIYGDEKNKMNDVNPQDVDDDDNTGTEPSEPAPDYKVLYEELKTKVASYDEKMAKFDEFLSTLEENEEDVDLKPKEEVQGEMNVSDFNPLDYDPWDIARNTRRIMTLRGK